MSKDALNKPILDFSEHGKRKTRFSLSFVFNGVKPLKTAAPPCAAGTSDLIRGSLTDLLCSNPRNDQATVAKVALLATLARLAVLVVMATFP